MTPLDLARHLARRRARERWGLELTLHALERMEEMGLGPDDVGLIATEGSSYPQRSDVTGRTGQIHRHPDRPLWAVVRSNEPGEGHVVVTVLFSTPGRYERDGRGFRPAAGADSDQV